MSEAPESDQPRQYDTRSVMERVLKRYGKEVVTQAILAMGYMGDGSLDDAGCVELAIRELDEPRGRSPALLRLKSRAITTQSLYPES